MPEISVILPVYGVEKYINSCLKSLEKQLYKDFEIILVDDGSPDNSIKVAESFLEKSDMNFQIVHQQNSGVSVARNTGIQLANGKWIMCMDPDDTLHMSALKIVSETIENNKHVDVIGIGFRFVQDNEVCNDTIRNINQRILSKEIATEEFLFRRIKIISPGLIIKKDFLIQNSISYKPGIKFSEDQIYIWNILSRVKNIAFISNELYFYLIRPNSTMTASKEEKILTGYKAFYELHKDIEKGTIDCGKYGKYILPRWILGVLHSSAKHMNYAEFKHLSESMCYKRGLKELIRFPEKKSKLLVRIGLTNRFLFYTLMKKI